MTLSEAYDQICKGEYFNSYDILKLRDKRGHLSLAHEQVRRDWITEDPKILRMEDAANKPVAHYQAERGWTTNDPKLLKLREFPSHRSLAHFQVAANSLKYMVKYKPWKQHYKEVPREQWFTEDPEILSLSDYAGWSVAHLQAIWGWTTDDPEILFIENIYGESVASLQRQRGWRPTDPVIKRRIFVNELARSSDDG